MRYRYVLRISGADLGEVTRALGVAPSNNVGDWNLALDEGPGDSPIPFLDVFLNILDGRFASLERLGVGRNDISVWILYEYDEQCNMEFSAVDMKRLGDAGISLCVSCWSAAEA